MPVKGYTTHGSREMIEVGTEALEALRGLLDRHDDAEVAEFRVYENTPVEAVVCDDLGFTTYVWTRTAWVAV